MNIKNKLSSFNKNIDEIKAGFEDFECFPTLPTLINHQNRIERHSGLRGDYNQSIIRNNCNSSTLSPVIVNYNKSNKNELLRNRSKFRFKILLNDKSINSDDQCSFHQIYINQHNKKRSKSSNQTTSSSNESESYLQHVLMKRLNTNTNRPCCNFSKRPSSSNKNKKPNIPYQTKHNGAINEALCTFSYNSDQLSNSHLSSVHSKQPSIHNQSGESTLPNIVEKEYSLSIEEAKAQQENTLGPPSNYTVSHYFYIYLAPSMVDRDLQLFQNHELCRLMKNMDQIEVQRIIWEVGADLVRDRRIQKIQEQTECYLEIANVKGNGYTSTRICFINGLPRRRITIHSTNYLNIARALSLMETAFPEMMRLAVFLKGVPCEHAGKWSSGSFITSNRTSITANRRPQCLSFDSIRGSWFTRIDPSKRHPFHHVRQSSSINVGGISSKLSEQSNHNSYFRSRRFSLT